MSLKISQQTKILELIEKKYRPFFEIHRRLFSTKIHRHVAVVSPYKFNEFLKNLMKDDLIPESIRLAIGVTLSGGLRASEALAIRRFDCERGEQGDIYIHVKVGKKKRLLSRPILVHPEVALLLKRVMIRKRGLEKIFDFGRSSYLKNIKHYLGSALDLHALRHSFISMLILNKQMSIPEVAKLMEISVNVIQDSYFHMDSRAKLKELWEIRKAS